MEEALTSQIVCENCGVSNGADKTFCTSCSFPTGGTEEEKKRFKIRIAGYKILARESAEEAKSTRNTILVLAGLIFVSAMISWFSVEDVPTLVINLMICVIYLGLAAWCTTNPFGAILTAMIIYVTITVLILFLDPTTLLRGIFFKIFIIGAFIRGIRAAKQAKENMDELKRLKAAPDAVS